MLILVTAASSGLSNANKRQSLDQVTENVRQAFLQARSYAQAGKKDCQACGAPGPGYQCGTGDAALTGWRVTIVDPDTYRIEGVCGVNTTFLTRDYDVPGFTLVPSGSVTFYPIGLGTNLSTPMDVAIYKETGPAEVESFRIEISGEVTGVTISMVIPTPGPTATITPTLGPTSTPTRTPTPAPPTPTPTTAIGNYALQFYGHGTSDIDRVKILVAPVSKADIGAGDFTIEWWMKSITGNNGIVNCGSNEGWITGNIMIDRDQYGSGDYGDFGISLGSGKIGFGVSLGGSGTVVCGATTVTDGNWHHVAVTRVASSGAIKVFVDGALDGQGTGPTGNISYNDAHVNGSPNGSDPYLVLGAEKHDAGGAYPSYHGAMDELRVSSGLRYTTAFTVPGSAFSNDANTILLYHFNEGSGLTLVDSATSPLNGTINYGGSAPAGPVYVAGATFGGGGGPTATPTPGTQVASVRVNATEKDGESYGTTEYYLLTNAPWNTMYLGSDGSPYDGGWIFQTAIPQGATVTNATVTITGGGDNSGTVAGSWYGFRTVAVPDFEDGVTNHRISDHVTRTTLSTPDNFGVVGSGATHVSPNLATVVQEVVSLPGFTGLIGMTYRSSTTGVNYQSFMDHSNDPNQAALLTVTYTAGGGGTPTPTPTPSSSIAGWWKFDENSGVSAGDSSGSGNTLTFGGNPTWSVGKVGSALTFDGTDDKAYVADPINGSLDMGSGDFSLAAWVKLDPTYTDANPTVIFKGAGSDTEPGYWLFWSNSSNYLRFTISSGVGTRPTVNSTAGVIKDNLWHHVAAVAVRSGVSKLYIDGVLNASSNWSAYTGSIDTASNFVIGSHLIGPAATDWKGQIDDVRMYEKALSDVEITDIYNQGALTPTATPTSTPVPVNLLANPGFESGTTGWSFYTDGTGTFNTTTPGASGAGSKARVTLTTLGTNTQMWQKPLSFATNTSYRLSYKAYGSRSGEKVGAFIDNVNASQMGNVATMSTSWQTFTFDFVTPAAIYDPANAGLRFWFANSQGVSGNQAGDIFYIDDVSITPL